MSQPQAETRFIELMAELFQIDEAKARDFGLYRVIRRHNREVRAFLGEIVPDQGWKVLKGGQLSAVLAEAFREAAAEAAAEDQRRVKKLSGKKRRSYAGFQFFISPKSCEIGLSR